MTTHIRVSKKTRLTITPDAEPLNPRTQIECVTGYFRPLTAARPFDGPPSLHNFPGPLEMAHERLWGYHYVEQEKDVVRWARINYGLALIFDDAGYWFADRSAWNALVGTEFSIEHQTALISHDISAWRRFVDKRAEVVTLERRATYRRITPSRVNEDDLLHVWEPVDSISDVYLDDYGSYARVATDHFAHEFSHKERTIFAAMLDAEATAAKEGGDLTALSTHR